MKDSCYLRMNDRGIVGYSKGKPALKSGEHAVKVKVAVDDRYFIHAIPVAELTIGEEHIVSPQVDVSLEPAPV